MINYRYLLTKPIAQAVLGNIDPRSFLCGPHCAQFSTATSNLRPLFPSVTLSAIHFAKLEDLQYRYTVDSEFFIRLANLFLFVSYIILDASVFLFLMYLFNGASFNS